MSDVFIITGPSGAGKTTVSNNIAVTSSGTWAFIEQDRIRELIKSGFKNPDDHPWTDESHNQWDVSIEICADIARRYQKRNINCIIEAFIRPEVWDEWKKELEGIQYKLIILLPNVDTTKSRNDNRSGIYRLRTSLINEQHKFMSEWAKKNEGILIDSSNHSVETLSDLILTPQFPDRKIVGDSFTRHKLVNDYRLKTYTYPEPSNFENSG